MNNYRKNKIRLLNNGKIISTEDGNYVIKSNENVDSINNLYSYLNSKGFSNYLNYLDEIDGNVIYPYIETTLGETSEEASIIIEIIAFLHKKTAFYKTISLENVREKYEEQIKKLEDLEKYYDELVNNCEEEEYLSPSLYYFLRNSSLIFHSLKRSRLLLDNWYSIIKDKKSKRVCLIHGNLCFEHFLNSDNKYLISWSKSRNDINIYDLISFYKDSYDMVPFIDLLDLYNSIFPMLREEEELFFSLILEPAKFTLEDIEINNVSNIYSIINYLNKSNELVSNYHSSNSNSKSNEENE